MTSTPSLPAPVRGILWMTAAAFFFAVLMMASREISGQIPPYQQGLFQALGVVIVMSPWVMVQGIGALKTAKLKLHLLRSSTAVVGMWAMFYAIGEMPLADLTAILFTTPFFTVLLAWAFLKEPVGLRRWAAISVGFIGALFVIRPGFAEISWAVGAMLVSAFVWGVVNSVTRTLTRTENINAMVIYMYGLMGLFSLIPAILVWETPTLDQLPMIALLGVATACAQQCITRSLRAAPPSIVMPAHYLQLPFAAMIGIWLYDEIPVIWIWVGAAIICAATYYMARVEAKLAAEGRAA